MNSGGDGQRAPFPGWLDPDHVAATGFLLLTIGVASSTSEGRVNWKRVVGYGFALWAAPFVVSCLMFSVRQSNRPLFESLITVIGVAGAVTGALLYFRDERSPTPQQGIALGFIWAAISVAIDLPIFLSVFGMTLPGYAADIGLSYLAFPAIAVGIALARRGALRQN